MDKKNNLNKTYFHSIDNEPIEISFGESIIPVFKKNKGSDFRKKIENIRKQIASEWGVIIPEIHMRDDTSLDPYEYVIKIQSVIAGKFRFKKDQLICIYEKDEFKITIKHEEFIEPVFGLRCFWINKRDRKKAELDGGKILNTASVIAAHLNQSIKSNIKYIVSYENISELIDNIKENVPILMQEIQNNEIRISHISLIIKSLLSNCIPLNNFAQILELINEAWLIDKDIQSVNSYVLSRLLEKKLPVYNNKKKAIHSEEIDESEIKGRPYEVAVLDSTFCGIILRYDKSTMNAPQIIMKRSGTRIYELIISAITANLPFVNNSDAAQTIFRSYEEGDEIEEEMYLSVALLYAKLLSTRQCLTHDIH